MLRAKRVWEAQTYPVSKKLFLSSFKISVKPDRIFSCCWHSQSDGWQTRLWRLWGRTCLDSWREEKSFGQKLGKLATIQIQHLKSFIADLSVCLKSEKKKLFLRNWCEKFVQRKFSFEEVRHNLPVAYYLHHKLIIITLVWQHSIALREHLRFSPSHSGFEPSLSAPIFSFSSEFLRKVSRQVLVIGSAQYWT